jgi:gliding motility-associated-like protein/uncharacterized repeat protein (TIGR01451 family)
MLLRTSIFQLLMFCSHLLLAQPFTCLGNFILTVSSDADSSRFYRIRIDDDMGGIISFDEFSTAPGPYLNAIGYRQSDNYVYGIAPNTHDLYRLDASGNTAFLHHFDEFEEAKTYNAGAVTPDSRYLVVLSGISSSAPFRNTEIILIELASSDYNTTITPLTTLSGKAVYSLDIAFDPVSGVLYGYDGNEGRLITISLSGALVDDLSYPATGTIDIMAAMFFDTRGNLFGYAKHLGQLGIKAFYRIDKVTGTLNFLLEGPFASASDGCSCPYRVELFKTVEPQVTTACSEVEYTFKVVNTSNSTQSFVRFKDVFPPEFVVKEVRGNIYVGQITGLNTGTLVIEDMMITPGTDSFIVRVLVNNVPPGIYKNQAVLTNLSPIIGTTERSDDPNTIFQNDSTAIEILPLEIMARDTTLILCPGDTLQLDATFSNGIFSYLWQDGTASPTLEITQASTYEVVASNDCETVLTTFEVKSSSPGYVLSLGPEISITLGDRIYLNPDTYGADNPFFNWSESPGQTIDCDDCPSLDLLPVENTTYFLTLTDAQGCIFSDSLKVTVEKRYQIYVPNTFSPNNDGVNDQLFIYGESLTVVERFVIYNRWGGAVFKANDNLVNEGSTGWDGKINDEYVQLGVYTWMARIKFIDGEVRYFSGTVTVIY